MYFKCTENKVFKKPLLIKKKWNFCMGWMECFSCIYPLYLCYPAFGYNIYSNGGGREVEIFFRFSTYLIRAIFRVYESIEIYYLIKLEGLLR